MIFKIAPAISPAGLARSGVACMLALLLVAGCTRKPEPLAGGGDHRVTRISIQSKDNNTLLKEGNPVTLRAGERLPLRVVASWAIPYVGDVTEKTQFSLSDPSAGTLDDHAVFTAAKPGKVTIDATLRVAARAGGHEVLAPKESAGADPVLTFRDQVVVNVTE